MSLDAEQTLAGTKRSYTAGRIRASSLACLGAGHHAGRLLLHLETWQQRLTSVMQAGSVGGGRLVPIV